MLVKLRPIVHIYIQQKNIAQQRMKVQKLWKILDKNLIY